ncbi:MAG: HIT family protein [Bacteroidales bacterium 43_8]|nr:MAG: HIT family protein [Bacteroidales bacterium 43_8]
MASIFSRIVAGEIPCYKVAEDENYFAFLDISPVAKGHTLVIPKQEVDYIFDLDDETYVGLTRFAKRVAKAIEKAIPCKRVGVAVMGLEVPHTHIHLVPINKEADMNFFRDKLSLESTEMQAIAEAIARESVDIGFNESSVGHHKMR